MAKRNDDALVVTLTGEVGARIRQVARDQHRSEEEIVSAACRNHLAALEAAKLEEAYRKGYERLPEDTTELEALLPHLPVPREDW